MSSALVRGLCTLTVPPKAVILSPRNAQKAQALADAFAPAVSIAPDNQAVVDGADVVFIGVLPAVAEETLRALSFSPRHTIISVVSTAPLASLREWCAPVHPSAIIRAIPLPPVAMHKGTTVLTPAHPLAVEMFDALGTAVAVGSEAEMKKMMTITTLMGQFYAQQRASQCWLERQGIDASAAARYIGAIYHTISYDAADAGPHTFEELVSEQTPGGLNEQVLRELSEAGAFSALTDALDGALARIEGRPRPQGTKRPHASVDT
eukprot:CAMPEP_0119395530 /NCGR_PEP_ID=MMETSP1334-20130426/133620_1 /TAXON_ID=127549 /ORGANISM="Calcidiscus leptoporus, Strain RCC1130" /LENGTH=263 /DNA_ID=CAMNT_0007419025 /DNA_START=127 /DNA_END=918 /DNA_ORIENTATION=-